MEEKTESIKCRFCKCRIQKILRSDKRNEVTWTERMNRHVEFSHPKEYEKIQEYLSRTCTEVE